MVSSGIMTEIAKGLEGVQFTESKLTFINGSEGILLHLGIPIQEWAENSTFEELSLALLDGKLPTATELATFDAHLKENREIPHQLLDVIKAMPRGINPMQALRTAVSYLGLLDPHNEDITPEAHRAISIRMIAQFSTLDRGHRPGQGRQGACRPPQGPDPRCQLPVHAARSGGRPPNRPACSTSPWSCTPTTA